MGKKASAPPAPDYAGAAKAQGAANVEAARASAMLSNPNIYGPLGSQTVKYEGDIPTVTQTLTPEAQATLQAQQQVDRRLAELGLQGVQTAERTLSTPFQTGTGELNTVFDLSGLPRAPVNAGTTAQEAIMARLEPQIQRSRAQLETQLANQGLARGGEAYNAAIREQQQQENDLRSQAALQGIGLDTQARAQAASEQQAAMGFENQARAQALREGVGQRALERRGQGVRMVHGGRRGVAGVLNVQLSELEKHGLDCRQVAISTFSAWAWWRSSRTDSVRRPRSARKASSGAMAVPDSNQCLRMRSAWALFEITAPTMASEWPTMYLVQASTQMSTPRSSGRQ